MSTKSAQIYLLVPHHPQYRKPNLLEGCLVFLLEYGHTFLGLPVFQRVLSISKTTVNLKQTVSVCGLCSVRKFDLKGQVQTHQKQQEFTFEFFSCNFCEVWRRIQERGMTS